MASGTACPAGEAGWPEWLVGRASTAGGHGYTRGLSLEGETTMWKRLTLEEKMCWVTSVRCSPTSGRSEKVEHHISEEKIHKPES